MTWNYRVLRTVVDNEDCYAIHEVYYDSDGKPELYTEDPVNPSGETFQEFEEELAHYRQAMRKPVLTEADFKKEES